MKHAVAVALLLLGLRAAPVEARNLAVPADNPVATLTVPDSWAFDEIEYGYSAMSPGKDVFFAIESAPKTRTDAMFKNNKSWMKENGIDGSVEPKKGEITFGGIPATVFQYATRDNNGPTVVEFILMPAGRDRLMFVTLWGSDEEREKHGKAIDAIMGSFKAIQ